MQKGFERNPKRSPKFWQNILQLGKVISVRAAAKTVDIAMINGGAVYRNVPVLAPMATTSSGVSHLPKPQNPKADTEQGHDLPGTYGGRDIFAIVGFVEGVGTMPVVLGFRYPKENQLSFSNNFAANHHIDRHESDRYHRITGDTVAEFGGDDVPGEEETRYPDNSYFKVVKSGGSRALTDLSDKNQDADTQPFIVKKEDRKGFYFQHASGTRIFIGPDGQIKIGHHTGSWISLDPDTSDLPAEAVDIGTVDSKNDPPAAADAGPVKIHIEHSSGTKCTIQPNGQIDIVGVGDFNVTAEGKAKIVGKATVEIDGAGSGAVKGVVQGDCICSYTGQIHPMISGNVKSSL